MKWKNGLFFFASVLGTPRRLFFFYERLKRRFFFFCFAFDLLVFIYIPVLLFIYITRNAYYVYRGLFCLLYILCEQQPQCDVTRVESFVVLCYFPTIGRDDATGKNRLILKLTKKTHIFFFSFYILLHTHTLVRFLAHHVLYVVSDRRTKHLKHIYLHTYRTKKLYVYYRF